MKKIYILLTRSTTITSKIVYLLTGDTYTHVSIAFESNLQTLYSSGRKNGVSMFPAGPCVESFSRGFFKRQVNIPCALYVLEVGNDIYDRAKKETEEIIGNADYYKFNVLGMLLCRLNIAFQTKRYFFCSQFVSEILRRSCAMHFEKDTSLIRPSDYTRMSDLRCKFEGRLDELVQGFLPFYVQGGAYE